MYRDALLVKHLSSNCSLTSDSHASHICHMVQTGHCMSPHVPLCKKKKGGANITILRTATPATADTGLNINNKG